MSKALLFKFDGLAFLLLHFYQREPREERMFCTRDKNFPLWSQPVDLIRGPPQGPGRADPSALPGCTEIPAE